MVMFWLWPTVRLGFWLLNQTLPPLVPPFTVTYNVAHPEELFWQTEIVVLPACKAVTYSMLPEMLAEATHELELLET